MFLSSLHQGNAKTRQSLVILNLCWRKTQSEKSPDYRDANVFEKLRFQNVFPRPHENEKPAFPNAFGLKSVLGTLQFRNGLVWTVVWTGIIVLCFSFGERLLNDLPSVGFISRACFSSIAVKRKSINEKKQ